MDAGVIVAAVITGSAMTAASVITAHAALATKRGVEANGNRMELLLRGHQDERIADAVRDYAAEHPNLVSEAVMFEAMRDLLDAIIGANLDSPRHHHRQDTP